MVAPNWSENQYRIAQVINVDTCPSLIAGQALLNPMFIDDSIVRPVLNSSFILSKINMFASTAIPMDRIAAATPDRVKVIGNILNIVKTINKIFKDKDFKKYARRKPESIKDIEITDNWARLKTFAMCVR